LLLITFAAAVLGITYFAIAASAAVTLVLVLGGFVLTMLFGCVFG
jgi:hypothetical protein